MKRIFLSIGLSLLVICSNAQSSVEKQMGDATHQMLKKTQGFYENDKVLQVVREIGHNLEKELALGYPLQFFLLDTTEPNAFATAGGYVYVTRGLLAILDSRDELAGILAHELSHVTQHHASKKLTASLLPLALELPAKLVGLLTYKELAPIINYPIDQTSKIALASYDRNQEREADKLGAALAKRAGYNPYGLVIALERLTDYVKVVSGKTMKKTLFIDHPVTAERTAYLTTLIEKDGLKRTDFPAGTDIVELDGVLYGQDPSNGMIVGSAFIHPDIDLYCELPAKWTIQNARESVTAISPDNKSTIIISVDTSAATPLEAAKKFLTHVKESTILAQKAQPVNGNEAYRATIRNKSIKYADHVSEIMWFKMPSSQVMIKVIGVSGFAKPDKDIAASLETFRLLSALDLKGVTSSVISLRSAATPADIEGFVQSAGNDSAKQLELLAVLNNLAPGKGLPEGRFLKIVQHKPVTLRFK
jgi:predicted Zn-dependent protease